jgi:hypothetical protein
MEIAILIGWVAVLFSSIFISFKVYRTLKARGNNYATFFAIVAFPVSFIIMAIILIAIIAVNGGFSRR